MNDWTTKPHRRVRAGGPCELDIVPPQVSYLRLVPQPKPEPVRQRPRPSRARGLVVTVISIALIAAGTCVLLAPIQTINAVASLHVGHR